MYKAKFCNVVNGELVFATVYYSESVPLVVPESVLPKSTVPYFRWFITDSRIDNDGGWGFNQLYKNEELTALSAEKRGNVYFDGVYEVPYEIRRVLKQVDYFVGTGLNTPVFVDRPSDRIFSSEEEARAFFERRVATTEWYYSTSLVKRMYYDIGEGKETRETELIERRKGLIGLV